VEGRRRDEVEVQRKEETRPELDCAFGWRRAEVQKQCSGCAVYGCRLSSASSAAVQSVQCSPVQSSVLSAPLSFSRTVDLP
jgi:hypothetical protein